MIVMVCVRVSVRGLNIGIQATKIHGKVRERVWRKWGKFRVCVRVGMRGLSIGI